MTDQTPPAADQSALRDRIAEALLTTCRTDYDGKPDHRQHRYNAWCALCTADVDALAAAVLAVLPAPVDRVAVLRDFLWRLEQSAGDATAEKLLDDNPELRRLAAEARTTDEAGPS